MKVKVLLSLMHMAHIMTDDEMRWFEKFLVALDDHAVVKLVNDPALTDELLSQTTRAILVIEAAYRGVALVGTETYVAILRARSFLGGAMLSRGLK